MRTATHFLILILLPLCSCNINPNQQITPNWNTNLLGPLVKTSLTLDNFSELEKQNIHATQIIYMNEVSSSYISGFAAPAVTNVPLGPFTLNLTNAFTQATFDSGQFYFVVTNGFPIDAKKGTIIKFTQNGVLFTQDTLKSDLKMDSTYTLPVINLAGKTLLSEMTLNVTFSSDGSNGMPVTFTSSNYFKVEVFLSGVKLHSATVLPQNTFHIDDTTNFQISGDVIRANAVSGNFISHFGNGLPLSFNVQAYFLDENKKLIDSLFIKPTTLASAELNNCINYTVGKTLDTIPYNSQKQAIINDTRFVWLSFTIQSHGSCPSLIITEYDTLAVQIVGDLTLNITN